MAPLRTPLQAAVEAGSEKCVALLVKHKADVTTQSKHEKLSMWHIAINRGFDQVCTELAKAPKPNGIQLRNLRGDSALHVAMKIGNGKMVAAIIRAGGDCQSATKSGALPLHIALQRVGKPLEADAVGLVAKEIPKLEDIPEP